MHENHETRSLHVCQADEDDESEARAVTRLSTIDGIVTRHIDGLTDNHQPL